MIGDLFKYWTYQVFSPGTVLREKYEAFQALLEFDQKAHEKMAELQRIFYEALQVDTNRVIACYDDFAASLGCIVDRLEQMCPWCYADLKAYYTKFDHYIRHLLATPDIARNCDAPYAVGLSPASEKDPQFVGGKAHALLKVLDRLEMNVPRGFVITTNTYHRLIQFNRLGDTIRNHLSRIHPDNPASLAEASDKLTAAILEIEIPPPLHRSVNDALAAFIPQEHDHVLLAVRSSAVGEDSNITFAGQYRSCLKVRPDDLMDAYRRVLASKFSPTALYYRIRAGLDDAQTPMAVLVMEMIDPLFSGVLYTSGPTPDKANISFIHYVSGLGEGLVSGDRKADVITIRHDQDGRREAEDGRAPDPHSSFEPGLDAGTVSVLSDWALQLERFLDTPCDVEWCQDASGRVYLLQCRPLHQPPPSHDPPDTAIGTTETVAQHHVLYEGGLCACPGSGSGPLFYIAGDDDLENLPERCVALLTTAPPHYAPILDRVSAVILERGSIAGHFQAVAREFNIPTLVNAEDARTHLRQGETVTVIADACKVVTGALPQSAPSERDQASDDTPNPLRRRLAAAMDFISPLKLTDPHAPKFAPHACRSMHDILRFAHEKAIHEMFSIGDRRMKRKSGARRLVGELPMVIYVLDVGGGIEDSKARKQAIRIDDLTCQPMHDLWKGMLHPDIQWSGHRHFDWAEYDRMVMDGGIISPESAMFSSYAVVADQYLNFCLKFGYHFAIIDTLCQEASNGGHIWFRFTGGGANTRGKLLRVRFTKTILSELGFSVKTEGELINARLEGFESTVITQRLERVGHLLGVTRLMDMHLHSEAQVDRLVNSFFNHRFKHFDWETEEEDDDER